MERRLAGGGVADATVRMQRSQAHDVIYPSAFEKRRAIGFRASQTTSTFVWGFMKQSNGQSILLPEQKWLRVAGGGL